MKELIQKLVEAYGPSGNEDQVREIVRSEIEGYADELTVSTMGGLHAIKNPGGGPKVMLAAHMDEIGLIISHVDANGFARFHGIGGLNVRTLVGHRVRFSPDIIGIIGIEDPRKRALRTSLDRLFIDFGADSKEDCPVGIGDSGAFERPFVDLGDRMVAKSMDDRIGVAVLIETMRQLKKTPNEVQFAFTVQEEVGLRGAVTSAFGLDPEVGIAVDITRTGDTPKGLKIAIELGKGPAIKIRDSRMLSDPRLVELMVQRAQARRIPYQLEVLEGGTTDAAAIQLSRSGVPAGCISIPCRYIHTPSEMVDTRDVENAISLLLAILEKPVRLP